LHRIFCISEGTILKCHDTRGLKILIYTTLWIAQSTSAQESTAPSAQATTPELPLPGAVQIVTPAPIRPGTIVTGNLAPVPNGVIVVQSTNLGRTGGQGMRAGTLPAIPSIAPTPPPSIPVGYVVVQTTYLELVSAHAKSAIDAAKANEESLVGIMKVAGWILAVLIALVGFFGFKEFRDIRNTQEKLTSNLRKSKRKLAEIDSLKNEVLPQIQAAISEVHDMEAIMVEMWFLNNVYQHVKQLKKNGDPLVVNASMEALPDGRRIFAKAKALHDRRITAAAAATPQQSGSLLQNSTTNVTERVLSFIAAIMGILATRAGVMDEAVEWARKSVEFNPMNLEDRKFNLACALAQRFISNGGSTDSPMNTQCVADKAEVLRILSEGIASNTISWQEAWDDPDLRVPFRDELLRLKPNPPAPPTPVADPGA
jgi:hypothetical protein